MSYQNKYLKYKHKYQKLLQSAGAEPEVSRLFTKYGIKPPEEKEEQEPILYVNLIRVLSNDRSINKYHQKYQDLKKRTKKLNHDKLKDLILFFDSTPNVWKNIDSWDIIFENTMPIYNTNSNMDDLQKNELASNPIHMLFGHDFKFFQTIIKNTHDYYYYKLNNIEQWLGIKDVSDLNQKILELKYSGSSWEDTNIDNCYGIKKEIPDESEVIIIGDIHSSFHSLYEIINNIKSTFLVENTLELKENRYIIFTGDITDYGPYSLEVFWFVLTLHYYNPEKVFILKGNHENYSVYADDTRPNLSLIKEIIHQFNVDHADFINQTKEKIIPIIKTLSILPTVLFLKFRGHIYQFNHGSINLNFSGYYHIENNFAPLLSSLYQFLESDRKNFIYISNDLNDGYKWGDFYYSPFDLDLNKTPFKGNRQKHPHNVIQKYLKTHKIKAIISGHQDTRTLGILPVDENKMYFIIPSTNEPLYWLPTDGLIVTPDQETIETTLKEDNYVIPLKPGIDMMAVTLSTAVPFKKVKFTNYAILK